MPGLYAIVDPSLTGERDPVRVAEAILAGGCARLQLRDKRGPDRRRLALGRALAERCRAVGVGFVMNDRPDLARLCGADGLHLGQDDLAIDEARALVGDLEIGLSTHDPAQARAAAEAGADLVALGPIFDTTTKDDPDPTVGVETLAAVCAAIDRPMIAIGGVTLRTAPAIRAAGAAYGAAVSALCRADDPEAAARALHRALGGVA